MSSNGRMLRSERWLTLIAAAMFLCFGAYAAAFLWERSENETVTEAAEYFTVSESFSVKGMAFRPLTPIVSGGGEYVILAAEGERLRGGSAVAVKAENADAYFAFRDYELSMETFSFEADAVSALKGENAARRALAAVYLEGGRLPEECPEPEGIIRAPCAGIFTRRGNDIGSVADGYYWYFSFESDKVPGLRKGQKLRLELSSLPQVGAEVFSIDEENSRAVLIVSDCPEFIPTGIEENASVSLSGCSGLRVPGNAVHYDDDGTAFVNVLSSGTKEKKEIEIIYTARDYYLCDDRSLREGMEVIVSKK